MNQFYQKSFLPSPNLADDIYKSRQLDIQEDAVAARRAAANKPDKLGKAPTLSKGWSPHSNQILQAYNEGLKERFDAHSRGDNAGVAKAEQSIRNTIRYSQLSEKQGIEFEKTNDYAEKNSNKYSDVEMAKLAEFQNAQKQMLSTDGKGNLLADGNDIYTTKSTPFMSSVSLQPYGVDVYKDITSKGRDTFLDRQGERYYSVDGVDRDGHIDEKLRFYLSQNVITPEEAEEIRASAIDYYSPSDYSTPAPKGGNDGDKKSKYEVVETTESSTAHLPEGTVDGQGGDVMAFDIIYTGDKQQPNRVITFKNSKTGKTSTEKLAVNKVFKGGGDYYAYATGTSEDFDKTYANPEEYGITKRGSGGIMFKITPQNINQVESLTGKKLDDLFGEEENTSSTPQTQQEFNTAWAELKSGESLIGLDGVTYTKK